MTSKSAYTISSSNVTSTVGAATIVGTITGTTGAPAYGVFVSGSNDLLNNAGTILGQQGIGISGNGVTIGNQAGAFIGSNTYSTNYGAHGISISGSNALVSNLGTIQGLNGIYVGGANSGATISNQSSGIITGNGYDAVYGQTDTTLRVVNAGTITSNAVNYGAVGLLGGGSVTNLAGGVIADSSGAYGVKIATAAGTVTNAGTIDGGVTLAATATANRVIVDPGAVFTGHVIGGSGTLELASGSSTGTLNAVSTNFTNFSVTTLDSGASWVIEGGASVGNGLGTIAGFVATDTIQLTGHDTIAGQSTSAGVTHVTLTGSSPTVLNFLGTLPTLQFSYSSSGHVTNLEEAAGPTLTTGGTITFTGGGAGVVLDSTASITDTNNITSASVWIASGFLAGDQLSYTTQAGVTGSFNSSTGTLTLTGNASAAAFQSVVDSIEFSVSPSGVDPTQAGNDTSRTIDWKVADANGASSITSSAVLTTEASSLDYAQTVEETGIVAASESVNAGVMTLANAGGTVVGHVTVGNTLNSTGDFVLSNSGGNSTIVVDAIFGTYTSGVTLLTDPTTITSTGRVTNTAAARAAVSGPSGTAWTLVNQGLVSETASGGIGVSLAQSGTIINAAGGTVTASAYGVALAGGGIVTNASGAVISATGAGVLADAAATIVNAGSITGSAYGVSLSQGGTITNQSGGTIGGGTDAVQFGANQTNRLVIDPGAVFSGAVDGGNTIGAASISTLELASSATTGTLSGLGTKYIDFGRVTVDSGAQWMLAGSNTLVSGVTLTDSGTLTNVGTLLGAGRVVGAIAGAGVFLASGGTLDFTSAIGGGVTGLQVGGGATLRLDGPVNAGDAVAFDGSESSTSLELTGTSISGGLLNGFAATIAGLNAGASLAAPTNAIDLADIVPASIISASLNTATDILTVDATEGTFQLTLSGAYAADTAALVTADGNGGSDLFLALHTGLPVVSVPGAQTIGIGQSTTIAGVSVSESGVTPGETFTVALSDAQGLLSVTGSGAASVTGDGSTSVVVSGSLTDVDNTLATLADADGTAGSGTINIGVTDSYGNAAASNGTIAVTVNGAPAVTVPGAQTLTQSVATGISGLSVSESGNTAAPESFTVTLTDTDGILTATGGIQSNGGTTLTISGTLAAVNAALATLSDTDATTGADTISVAATDSFGNTATLETIPITVVPPGQTYTLTTGADTVSGGGGNNTIDAATNTLSAGDEINGGSGGHNTLALLGAGTFNLSLPTTLTNVQVIDVQEGQPGYGSYASAVQTVTLRNGMDATVNVAAAPANPDNPKAATINIIGAQNADVINLASGNDIVTVGSAEETVNGGSGMDEIAVTATTIGATIDGGTSGKSSLVVTGGGTVTMGSSVTNISTVLLEGGANTMTFIANSIGGLIVDNTGTAANTMTAGAASQTLTGGPAGHETMIGAAQGSDTFQDTAALFNGDTISGLVASDFIDLTNVSPGAVHAPQFVENEGGTSGVLTVTDGSHTAAITLTGQFSSDVFQTSADSSGNGTLVWFHAG